MTFGVRELLRDKRLVLASASPRRRELIQLLCDSFEIIPACGDESLAEDVSAFEAAEILAERKCREVAANCSPDENTLVIGCDTVVIAPDGTLMGKPQDDAEAVSMLEALQGNDSFVVSGVCVYFRGNFHTFSDKTKVSFYPASSDEIYSYVATGEPRDKAGAYAVQGLGGLFIRSIEGDVNNVIGMPMSLLACKLAQIVG